MSERKNIDLLSLLLYAPLWLVFICFSNVGLQAEPFGLSLLFALCFAGLNPFFCGGAYFLSSLFFWEWKTCLSYLLQGLLIPLCFYLADKFQRNRDRRIRDLFLPFSGLVFSLVVFCFLPDFRAYPLPFALPFLSDVWAQKGVFCSVILLLAVPFSVASYALFRKLLKCRLRASEILFSSLLYLLSGLGFCRFFGLDAYLGVSFFFLLLFFYVTKNLSGVVLSFLLSLPCALLGGMDISRFFILSILLTFFCNTGKWGLVFSLLAATFAFAYFDGLFLLQIDLLLPKLLSYILPCLFFLLLPKGLTNKLENELIFYREKYLSRITVNLGRAAVGGQLFELSALFKEIQTTFLSLNENEEGKKNAQSFIVNTVYQDFCRSCPSFIHCQARGLRRELQKLIEIGCQKGRVSLIDMSETLVHACERQSDLLHVANVQLTDFRRYMTEAENAASGRELLASQAQGVSEILKNVALEQSQPLELQTQAERTLSIAFLQAGIVCKELMLYHEDEEFTLSLITYGKTNVRHLADVAGHVLQTPLIISKKVPLSRENCCFILKKRPTYDAAFGIASLPKAGEKACGDNHLVVKIDEKRFIVALADGMGSGEYARKISACTLSLLESFYRAKMPSSLILSTLNKLLSFSKEETFSCVDIAVVDLENGKADLIKIGSPSSYVLSEKSLHVLESASLPLGILDSLRPACASYPLKSDDVLLFVSDGISGALGSTSDMCDLLKRASASNPQALADHLLEVALKKYGGVAKDDMTVVAVRLFKPADAA